MVKDLKSNQAKRRTETSLRILENEKNRYLSTHHHFAYSICLVHPVPFRAVSYVLCTVFFYEVTRPLVRILFLILKKNWACTVLVAQNSSKKFELIQDCMFYCRLPPLSSTAGLMVDWLELLDPEIIQACPDMQQQLLFAKQQLPSDQLRKSNHVSGQPYLLALLTHKTNWPMLHRCISRVLRPQNLTTR